MYSRSDEASNATDVLHLYAQLTNVTELYQIPIKDFKHIDFIYSRFVRQFVNEKVIDALKLADQYSNVEYDWQHSMELSTFSLRNTEFVVQRENV